MISRLATAVMWIAAISVAAWFWFGTARATDFLQVIPSTNDLTVTASATARFPIPGKRANWVWIRNDCATDLYFDLNPKVADSSGLATEYPIRLAQDQIFSGYLQVASIGVSPASGTVSCTFSLQAGR